MDRLKNALDALNCSIQKLENAVIVAKAQKSEDAEKIETLHTAIVTAYSRIDKALSSLQKGES